MKTIKGLCWRWGNVQVKLRRFQIRQHAGEQPNTLIFCLYIDREFLVMPVSKETDFNFRVFKNILEGFHLKKKKKESSLQTFQPRLHLIPFTKKQTPEDDWVFSKCNYNR